MWVDFSVYGQKNDVLGGGNLLDSLKMCGGKGGLAQLCSICVDFERPSVRGRERKYLVWEGM